MNPDFDLSRVHMIGIGGAGMSGLARILLARGATVTGSDIKNSTPVEVLRTMGAKIAVGHDDSNLRLGQELPTVVVTSFAAVPQDNPELVAARNLDIPIIRRSDLLAALMSNDKEVLLAGTHGKTSTTSMAVVAMQSAGMDPSFAIGGQLNRAGTNAHNGTGDVFVAEADESDGSLLRYSPFVAVITNAEPDHLDYFVTEEAYFEVFDSFADRVVEGGYLVVCLEDEHAAAIGLRAKERGIQVLGYGQSNAKYPAIPLAAKVKSEKHAGEYTKISADIVVDGHTTSLDYQLSIPGHHMVLNSLAAILAGTLAGGNPNKLAAGITDFTGVRRRFEYRGEKGGVKVFDDYAHHPTEVAAVLGAAREKVAAENQGAKIIACFQPHLYSRTIKFQKEFAQALSLADVAVVLDIYGARERAVEGVTSRIITEKMADGQAIFEPDFSAAAHTVVEQAQPGDMILTIGAGSVTLLAAEILAELGAR